MGRHSPEDLDRVRNLLEQVAHGSKAAFAALYDETSPYVYGALLRLLRNPQWATDALQDCYIRVWQHADGYAAERGDPYGWLIGIARYRALDLLRAQTDRAGRLAENASDLRDAAVVPKSPETEALTLIDLEQLQRCLAHLPAAQRECLLLGYYEGHSNQELADRLHQPLGTVKAWIRRGLVRLRSCMEGP